MSEFFVPNLAWIGITELWPIAIVVLLLFGARKLPELAHAMGSSINQFKKGLETEGDEEKKKLEGGSGDA
ncbi:MAG: twin-arginine translocase TatA/TatE family subunit [Planctomycetota bacterium]